ncbi:MAG: hypothetical protein AAF587_28325 [Bacteroidota bacterium]
MSSIGTYTFLPWLRQGIANQMTSPPENESRARIEVKLSAQGHKIEGEQETIADVVPPRTIEIYGPGDIVGIDQKAIFKVEPRNWITNFEPNYLPYIEFYDEDFPWRYTPLANPAENDSVKAHRLTPWLMLIVLKESEFKDGKNSKDRPLPYIQLESEAQLPVPAESWAWAHVHLNAGLMTDVRSTAKNNIQDNVQALLNSNPDLGYSRIVCPRKLEEKVAYHAFLVPVFESGRLAGIGLDPSPGGIGYAWDPAAIEGRELPYYHRWYFRTGTIGDFEYLVSILEPKPVDNRVGVRDMDVQDPGANLKGIEDSDLGGILKLGGALKVPDINYTPEELEEVEKFRNWATPYPRPFQTSLSGFINLTDSYEIEEAEEANKNEPIDQQRDAATDEEYDIQNNKDPLITAPLYGRWHALTQRLLKERDRTTDVSNRDNWVHELNLDPRWRVAAGFGTKVVQQNQEDYMKSAWEQVGEIIEANRRIRQAQLAQLVSGVWYNRYISVIKEKQDSRWLTLSAPLHARVLTQGFTVQHQVKNSRLPQAALSVNLRKVLRPRGKLVKRLPFSPTISQDNLLERINAGEVSSAPPRDTPANLNTIDEYADSLRPADFPAWLQWLQRWLEKNKWLKWVLFGLAILLLILLGIFRSSPSFLAIGTPILAVLVYLYRRLSNWSKQLDEAEAAKPENMSPEAVDKLPSSPDFRLLELGESFVPRIGSEDSVEAQRFKTATREAFAGMQVEASLGATSPKGPLDLSAVSGVMHTQLNPSQTIPRWVWGSVQIPGRIKETQVEEFQEAMAYPEFDIPMYRPLVQESAELFLPNINFVQQNSISLLETNQKFIEAYMVGLNHEFARELLWREYPTDQRGSYFRQFWDVSGFLNSDTSVEPESLKEKLKDIPPLHRWARDSKLGDHDHREEDGAKEDEVVLVIRGELLKKYPTAVIYAHRAAWKNAAGDATTDPSQIDPSQERTLAPIPEGQEANPPRDIIKSPLYEAKVEPDIYFFGFDLTACKAKGGTGDVDIDVDQRCVDEANISWDDPGWFFVIKERPGEPRFGLDISETESPDPPRVWNDLSWTHISDQVNTNNHITIEVENAQTFSLSDPSTLPVNEKEKEEQLLEDLNIHWNADMNAAELAYVLYQVPVLVAVHASEMLPDSPIS